MSVERIDIQIREDGSRVVNRNITDIGTASEKSAGGVDLLKRALGLLAGALAIDKIRQYADAWSSASGQIAVATKSHEEAAAVQKQLYAAAQRTRTGFGDLVGVYSAAARSSSSLGASQAEMIKFTEGVGKALVVQHVSAAQASGALLQLGQLLESGTVRSQEFNSILMGTPVILQTVAKGIGESGISVAELRAKMLAGQLTSKEFFEAFLKGTKSLDTDFAKASATIGQGLTVIQNALEKYIGEFDHANKISDAFGRGAKWIADNMDLVGTSLLALAAVLAVVFAPALIVTFTKEIMTLFAVINANPFIALAAAVAGAVVFISQYGDEVNAGIDKTTSLKDVFRALGEVVQPVFSAIASAAEYVFGLLDDKTKGVPLTFASMVKAIAHSLDVVGGFLIGFFNATVQTFAAIPTLLVAPFKMVYNVVLTTMEDLSNVVIGKINEIRKAVGKDPIELVKFDKAQFADAGKSYGEIFQEGFASQGGALEKSLDGVFSRASEIGKTRAAEAIAQAAKDKAAADALNNKGTGAPPIVDPADLEKQAKALLKLKDHLRSLLDTIAPVAGAHLEMAKAVDILNQSLRTVDGTTGKTLITQQQYDSYLVLLTQHYKDIVDPLGKINREMDEQVRLLNMSASARAIESQMTSVTQDLLKQGIQLDVSQTKALRDKLQAIQSLSETVSAQDKLLGDSVQKRKDFQTETKAIVALLADKSSGFTQGDKSIATANLAASAGINIEGTKAAIDAQLAQFDNMYARIKEMRAANLLDDQTAEGLRAKVQIQSQAQQLGYAQDFFGNLASLSQSGNQKLAAIGKAAAITQATIQGFVAVQNALAVQPYPVGVALAISAGVAAAANVAKIAGVGFLTGGDFKVGGTGGADSQLVQFRASPGEHVAVSTPTQVRKGDPNAKGGGSGDSSAGGNIRIVNLVDPAMLQDFLSTPDGERVLVNTLQRNAMAIKNIANS